MLAACLLAGCDFGSPRDASVERSLEQDSTLSYTSVVIDSTPTMTVGTGNGQESNLFQVSGATRLSSGELVIVNTGTSELRVYDEEGRFLRSMGGRGQGPGELQRILGFRALPNDSLLVLDSQGLTWFGGDGEVLRVQRFSPWPARSRCFQADGRSTLMGDGSVLNVFHQFCGIDNDDGRHRRPAVVIRHDPRSEMFDTLAATLGLERTGGANAAYANVALLALAEDRIYVADSAGDSILAVSFEGDALQALPMPFPARPLLPEARTGHPPRDPWPYEFPEVYPRAARLLVDEEGLLWVMRYPLSTDPTMPPSYYHWEAEGNFRVPRNGAEWRVLTPAGDLVDDVVAPDGALLLQVGRDYAIALSKDEVGRQLVSVHQVLRR